MKQLSNVSDFVYERTSVVCQADLKLGLNGKVKWLYPAQIIGTDLICFHWHINKSSFYSDGHEVSSAQIFIVADESTIFVVEIVSFVSVSVSVTIEIFSYNSKNKLPQTT